MATSPLGLLNPEALFGSAYACSSPFLADYAPSFPPAGDGDGDGDFWADQLDDHHHYSFELEYSPPTAPIISAGAGDDDCRRCESDDFGGKRSSARVNGRIGFRTRSEVEILDDGFKWRKYGKKAVKNSPNPRNYYRCSSAGCGVKKRVERDRDDHRYVVTTYDGIHNHANPDAALQYYSPPRSAAGSSPPAPRRRPLIPQAHCCSFEPSYQLRTY